MELARAGKLIGANLDAKVYLHTPSPALRALLAPLSDESGKLKSGEDNAVDTLRAIFLSSQVLHPWRGTRVILCTPRFVMRALLLPPVPKNLNGV